MYSPISIIIPSHYGINPVTENDARNSLNYIEALQHFVISIPFYEILSSLSFFFHALIQYRKDSLRK